MLRFIIKVKRYDIETQLRDEFFITIDNDLKKLETQLRSGGYGGSGYMISSVCGVEIKEEIEKG